MLKKIKFFLFVFSIYYLIFVSSQAFYLHIHLLPDGTIISLSHFYNGKGNDDLKGKSENHKHSNVEYYYLSPSQNICLLPIAGKIENTFSEEKYSYFELIQNFETFCPSEKFYRRAPPSIA